MNAATHGGLLARIRAFFPSRQPRTETFRVPLPSLHPGDRFEADIWITWRPEVAGPGHPNPVAAVRHWAYSTAESIAADMPLTQRAVAEDTMNYRLGMVVRIPQTSIRVVGTRVSLGVDPEQERLALSREQSERKAGVERARLATELIELEHLRDNVLADPGLTRSYLFRKSPERIEGLLSDDFEELAGRISGPSGQGMRPEYSETHRWIGEIVTRFLEGLDADERQHLLDQLAHVFRSYRRDELAEEINRDQLPPADDTAR